MSRRLRRYEREEELTKRDRGAKGSFTEHDNVSAEVRYERGVKRSRIRPASIAAVIALGVLDGGCHSTAADAPGPRHSGAVSPTAVDSRARILITPSHGTKADPAHGVSVTVTHGTLAGVTATGDGDPLEGGFGAGHTRWHSTWVLTTDTHYAVRATAIDTVGRPVTRAASFHTLAPEHTFSTTIFEGYHKTYGVGMPIILTFSTPITNKAAVERSLEIRTSRAVIGAWYWDGDRTLYFRPRTYWKADTRIDFIGHLDGVEGAPGIYGVHTLTQSWSIGRSLIAVANTQTHDVKVYLDRKLFGDWSMSAGRPGDDTPNGTYLTMEKNNPEEMVGPGYDILVPYSVRFTLSGDFIHDAYWSVDDQGFANVSHGCINLSPEHAKIYYALAVPGDPVTIEGSPKAGTWGNGWTVWFLSWSNYLEGSALHRQVRAGPNGSSVVLRPSFPPSHARPPLGTSERDNAEATAN
jgi:lipoprotein-anchoring transpeptidase ErfK/SrfK